MKPAVIVGLVAALFISLTIYLFPTKGDAASFARSDAGLTSVSRVEFKWFSWCHKDFVAYVVTGQRDGHQVKAEVCMTEFSTLDYVYDRG